MKITAASGRIGGARLKSFRQSQTESAPARPRIRVSRGPVRTPELEQCAIRARLAEQIVAQRQRRAVLRRNLHQAAGHVHAVTRRGDVLIAAAAEPGCDDGAEMGAYLEAGLRRDRWRQRFDPSFDAVAERDAAKRRITCVVHGALREPEQDHGAVAQETRDDSAVRHDIAVDQGMEFLQNFQHRVHSMGFAERGKAGQVDEDDRGILMHRREQKLRVHGQPCAERRRLELLQQVALHGEILRLPAVQPELHRAEQDCRRSSGRDRQGRAEPDAMRKCREIPDYPDYEHGQDREEADRTAPPRQQTHQQQRQDERQKGVDGAYRAVTHDPVAVHQMGNGGGDNLHARHHRIERRREHVAAAGHGGPDHDDPVSNGLRNDVAAQYGSRADGPDRAMAAIEGQRHDVVDVDGDLPSRQSEAVRLEGRLGTGCQCSGAQRERQLYPVAGSKQQRGASGRPGFVRGQIDRSDGGVIGK